MSQPFANFRHDSGIGQKSDHLMFGFGEMSDFNEMSESNSSELTGLSTF
jgi:hypothetical protein